MFRNIKGDMSGLKDALSLRLYIRSWVNIYNTNR